MNFILTHTDILLSTHMHTYQIQNSCPLFEAVFSWFWYSFCDGLICQSLRIISCRRIDIKAYWRPLQSPYPPDLGESMCTVLGLLYAYIGADRLNYSTPQPSSKGWMPWRFKYFAETTILTHFHSGYGLFFNFLIFFIALLELWLNTRKTESFFGDNRVSGPLRSFKKCSLSSSFFCGCQSE